MILRLKSGMIFLPCIRPGLRLVAFYLMSTFTFLVDALDITAGHVPLSHTAKVINNGENYHICYIKVYRARHSSKVAKNNQF